MRPAVSRRTHYTASKAAYTRSRAPTCSPLTVPPPSAQTQWGQARGRTPDERGQTPDERGGERTPYNPRPFGRPDRTVLRRYTHDKETMPLLQNPPNPKKAAGRFLRQGRRDVGMQRAASVEALGEPRNTPFPRDCSQPRMRSSRRARTAIGHAAAPSPAMNSRRFIR
jgi:hypothetical protein